MGNSESLAVDVLGVIHEDAGPSGWVLYREAGNIGVFKPPAKYMEP